MLRLKNTLVKLLVIVIGTLGDVLTGATWILIIGLFWFADCCSLYSFVFSLVYYRDALF